MATQQTGGTPQTARTPRTWQIEPAAQTTRISQRPKAWARPLPSGKGAALLGLGVVILLGSLSQSGREWTDFFCACGRLIVAAIPSVALAAAHALQAHAEQRILEGFLQINGCFGPVILSLIGGIW
jgi:hypothetical protein